MGPSLGATPTVLGRSFSAEETCRAEDAEVVGVRAVADDADAARGGRLGVKGRRNGICLVREVVSPAEEYNCATRWCASATCVLLRPEKPAYGALRRSIRVSRVWTQGHLSARERPPR